MEFTNCYDAKYVNFSLKKNDDNQTYQVYQSWLHCDSDISHY
jgi:hypothetical protein